MTNATPNQPEHGADNADPEKHGNFANGLNSTIEKYYQKNDQAAGNAFGLPPREWMQITSITCKSNGSRSNRKRCLYKSLPDKQERHHAAPATGTVGFAKEDVGATGFRHCRAEFRPDKTVESSQRCASEPGNQCLRAAHGLNDKRTDHEGTDAYDFDHVERDSFFEAEAALQTNLGSAGGRRRIHAILRSRHAWRE
jgi:hypothetical protein